MQLLNMNYQAQLASENASDAPLKPGALSAVQTYSTNSVIKLGKREQVPVEEDARHVRQKLCSQLKM
jgi:hypothetical protein